MIKKEKNKQIITISTIIDFLHLPQNSRYAVKTVLRKYPLIVDNYSVGMRYFFDSNSKRPKKLNAYDSGIVQAIFWQCWTNILAGSKNKIDKLIVCANPKTQQLITKINNEQIINYLRKEND